MRESRANKQLTHLFDGLLALSYADIIAICSCFNFYVTDI